MPTSSMRLAIIGIDVARYLMEFDTSTLWLLWPDIKPMAANTAVADAEAIVVPTFLENV